MQKDESEKESRLKVAQSEVDILRDKEQKEKCKLEQQQLRASTANNDLDAKSKVLYDHNKVLPGLKKSVEKMETEFAAVEEEYTALQRKVGTQRSAYEETRSSQQANRSRGKSHLFFSTLS